MILNLINANNFKRIIIVHNDVTTEEYSDIDADILDEIPPIDSEYFDKKVKTLLILEDLNFKNMNKEQKHLLNRMYGTSRHIIIFLFGVLNRRPSPRFLKSGK